MRFLFLLFFLQSTLFSNAFEPDPSIIVDGCVNPLTGTYFIKETDLIIEGKYPFTLTRTYSSQTKKWSLLPHTLLTLKGQEVKSPKEKKKKKKSPPPKCVHTAVTINEPTGTRLIYPVTEQAELLPIIPQGSVNTSHIPPSASTSSHNQKLIRIDPFTFKLITPEKIERTYTKAYSNGLHLYFLLRSESYPDGHTNLYEYDDLHRVLAVKSVDTHTDTIVASCHFSYFDKSSYEIRASDGQSVTYTFDGHSLTSMKHSSKPEEILEYVQGDLHKRIKQDKSILRIDYLPDGKVHALRNKFGKALHTFSYSPTYTDVLHTNNSKTRYTFGPFPEKIETFSSDEKLEQLTHFEWSTKGELLSKKTWNGHRQLLTEKRYIYDARGNPIEEIYNGTTTKKTFDALDRITRITNGTTTCIKYLGNSDQIASTTIGTNNKIYLRTRYDYNSKYAINKITVEDTPCTIQKDYLIEGDLNTPQSVEERVNGHFLKQTRYEKEDGVLYEAVYDKDNYLYFKRPIQENDTTKKPWEPTFYQEDLHGECEKDFFGRICSQSIYDSSHTLLREERWEYDTFHLLSYTDPEGVITRYEYNDKGQREKEIVETATGSIETLYFYDPIGRLEKIQTGDLITRNHYDEQGILFELTEETLSGQCIGKRPYSPPISPPSTLPFSLRDSTCIHKTYDPLGQLISVTSEDHSIHYSVKYNKRGQVTTITDHVHRRVGVRHYDDLGNLTEETLLNGLTLHNTYDQRGRRIQLTLPDQSTIHYRYGSKYLKELRRVPIDDTLEYRHTFTDYNLAATPIAQRMIAGFGKLTLDTDERNVVQAIRTRYLTQTTHPDLYRGYIEPKPDYELIHDQLGRVVQILQQNRQVIFTYDIWNRIMSEQVSHYENDVWVESPPLLYIYDDQIDIGAMQNKALEQLRVITPEKNQIVGLELANLTYAPIHDLDGNIKCLLSVIRNKLMETYSYSPSGRENIIDYWGETIPESKAGNPWRYRSARTDEGTGLIYLNKDFYDPQMKEWVSNSSR